MEDKKPFDIKSYIREVAVNNGFDPDKALEIAQKMYEEVYRPYGGAMSFSEIDEARKAQEFAYKVDDETYALKGIIENITSSSELDAAEKTSKIKSAADEYQTRVSNLTMGSEKSLLQRIKDLVFGKPEVDVTPAIGGFKVYRDKKTGEFRWLSISSNAFEDLEQELFTTKALEEAVEHADETGERGPLLVFHVPGTDIGQCDYQAIAGRFLMESGTFLDTPLGQKAVEYFEKTDKEFQVSIGYTYNEGDEEDGQYDWLRINERSICPVGHAANPWTDFRVIGGKELEERKVSMLIEMFGEDMAKDAISKAEAKSKELEEAGTRYKAIKDSEAEPPVTENPTDEEKPAESQQESEEKPEEEKDAVVTPQLAEILAELVTKVEALVPLASAIPEIQAEIKALKRTDDEKIAEAMSPRYKGPAGSRPSESNGNIVDEKVAEAIGIEKELPVNPVQSWVKELLGSASS